MQRGFVLRTSDFVLQTSYFVLRTFNVSRLQTRPSGDLIRSELGLLLAREVHDPGIGFVTITRVLVTPDLQHARVFYTSLGDEKARKGTRGRSTAPCRSSGGRSDRGCA